MQEWPLIIVLLLLEELGPYKEIALGATIVTVAPDSAPNRAMQFILLPLRDTLGGCTKYHADHGRAGLRKSWVTPAM